MIIDNYNDYINIFYFLKNYYLFLLLNFLKKIIYII